MLYFLLFFSPEGLDGLAGSSIQLSALISVETEPSALRIQHAQVNDTGVGGNTSVPGVSVIAKQLIVILGADQAGDVSAVAEFIDSAFSITGKVFLIDNLVHDIVIPEQTGIDDCDTD